jgi:hypothetical protein
MKNKNENFQLTLLTLVINQIPLEINIQWKLQEWNK